MELYGDDIQEQAQEEKVPGKKYSAEDDPMDDAEHRVCSYSWNRPANQLSSPR